MFLVALVAATVDPCLIRSDDVPCLKAPHCSDGVTRATPFYVCDKNISGYVAAQQLTVASVCWLDEGLWFRETAVDRHIFSPYTKCNQPVFSHSDVLVHAYQVT